jgi:FkbM family methyltransferase
MQTADPTHGAASHGFVARASRFWKRPLGEKMRILKGQWRAAAANIPVPIRLPFGALWLSRNDNMGEPLRTGGFERDELAFVGRFLRSGKTVLDVGAHQGLYSLLASKLVGPSGHVYSFEPSPRERRALGINLLLNLCRNVSVQNVALGREEGSADLYVVQGYQRGCNSLRPPKAESKTSPVRVPLETLDGFALKKRLRAVDFIKLDVEGGELDVLRGGTHLLESRPRPIILAEVQDIRTAPWGYRGKDILDYLGDREYEWFLFLEGGLLAPLDLVASQFDGNFLAVPRERLEEVRELRKSQI